MKKILSKISLRAVVQFSVLALVIYLAWAHQKYGIQKAASIDAYCPFGAAESFATWLFTGEFLKRIYWASFILGAIFFVSALFLGRVFCSWFCPLGTIQEWIRSLGRKMGIRKDVELPESVDKYLRYLKYVVLLVILYFSFKMGDLVFRNYDPYTALMHFGHEFNEKIIGYSLLIFIIISAFFAKGWWCRYLCPLGAMLGIFKKIGFYKIKKDESTCVHCKACHFTCPANLKFNRETIDDADCVSCGKCVGVCGKGSLSISIFGKKISKKTYNILIVIFILLPIIIIPFTPIWEAKLPSNVVKTDGSIDVENIRGSNTLEYLIETTGISFHDFKEEFKFPEDIDKHMKLKDIGVKYGLKDDEGNTIETSHFREFIEIKLGETILEEENDSGVDISQIKGSSTIDFIMEVTGISFEELQQEFNLPDDVDRTMKIKEIGPNYNLLDKEGNLLDPHDFKDYLEARFNK